MREPKKRIAIVGGGVAGLGCAHFLHNDFEVKLYEKNSYAGGHVNTVEVAEGDGRVAIDTGFMVFNKVTYPNFSKLLKRLDVQIKPTDMSFSVQHSPMNIEWSGTGFKRLFARRRNLINSTFWKFLFSVNEFNNQAKEIIRMDKFRGQTVEEFFQEKKLKSSVLDLYLLPMMSSLWSAPPEMMRKFPVSLLVRFMYTHGLLSVYDKLSWYTIDGGAKQYVEQLVTPFKDRLAVNTPVKRVTQRELDVEIELFNGQKETFDKCILACHANQSMNMISEESSEERSILSNFSYQKNMATLHSDTDVMPECPGNWASWNYNIEKNGDKNISATTHYWMNSLQNVSKNENYFVTIDSTDKLRPGEIIKQIEYEHPVFSVSTLDAQKNLDSLNQEAHKRKLLFAGSYFKYGFHEDAFSSAVRLSEKLLGRPVWN